MTQIVPLDKEAHRSLKVDGRASAAYGDDRHFVQVTVNEFPLLVVLPDSPARQSIVPSGAFINAPSPWSESDNQGQDGNRRSNTTRTSFRPWRL